MLLRKAFLANSGVFLSVTERRPGKSIDGLEPKADDVTIHEADDCKKCHLAMIRPEQFPLAQLSIFDLRGFADYDEWAEVQESRAFGVAIAGVEARRIPIELGAFLDWCRQNVQRPNSATLDKYAALVASDD